MSWFRELRTDSLSLLKIDSSLSTMAGIADAENRWVNSNCLCTLQTHIPGGETDPGLVAEWLACVCVQNTARVKNVLWGPSGHRDEFSGTKSLCERTIPAVSWRLGVLSGLISVPGKDCSVRVKHRCGVCGVAGH